MRIVVHTPVGVFYGPKHKDDMSEADIEDVKRLVIKGARSELSYMSLETDKGTMYFPEELLKNSVITIEK